MAKNYLLPNINSILLPEIIAAMIHWQPVAKKILRFLAFFGLGALLFYFAYKDQDINRIRASLSNVHYFWLLVGVVFSILSHVLRAMRWQLLIHPLGYRPRLHNTLYAVMVMYLANMALPRLGEVSRCGILNRYEKIPFAPLLGTVFLERMVDSLVLLLFIILALMLQFGILWSFITENFLQKFGAIQISAYWLVGMALAGIAALVLVVALYRKYRHIPLIYRIIETLSRFAQGLKSIAHIKHTWLFVLYSLGIFALYYLTLVVSLQAFDFTSHLGMLPALTVFVLGSMGMVAPAPGGIGAWHYMTYMGLYLYGVNIEPEGAAFAFVAHGVMTMLLIVGGFLSLLALALHKHESNATVAAT